MKSLVNKINETIFKGTINKGNSYPVYKFRDAPEMFIVVSDEKMVNDIISKYKDTYDNIDTLTEYWKDYKEEGETYGYRGILLRPYEMRILNIDTIEYGGYWKDSPKFDEGSFIKVCDISLNDFTTKKWKQMESVYENIN